jgi:hypothetical protein
MNSPLVSRACFGGHAHATPEESGGFRAHGCGVTRMLRDRDLGSEPRFSPWRVGWRCVTLRRCHGPASDLFRGETDRCHAQASPSAWRSAHRSGHEG